MTRKTLSVPFVTLAAVIALSSTAFACTVFKGTFTLKGNASTTKVTSTGTATSMTSTISPGIAKAKKTGGVVTLWAGADAYGRKLPVNNYLIRYFNGKAYDSHTNWVVDCMAGRSGVQLGTADVNSYGKFVGQPLKFSLPDGTANTAPQESAVCVSDRAGAYGNQVPVTIV